MKLKRKALITLAVDIPALDADQEGKLRGGFSVVVSTGRPGVSLLDGNCGNCNCGNCGCSNPNCGNCDCGNCGCTVISTTRSFPAGMNFLMF